VLLGTVYPILVEAITGNQVSVGRPFFDRLAVPLSFALLLAMGTGPFMPYRRATGAVLWSRLRLPLLGGSAAAAALILAGVRSPGVVVVVLLAVTITAASIRQLLVTAPARRPAALLGLVRGQRAYWGGQLAHVGVAVVAVAIAVSGGLATRDAVTLDLGESTRFAGYTITFDKTDEHRRSDRLITDAHLVFRNDGDAAWTATPRLTAFDNQPQAVGAPSVWVRPGSDIYVALSTLTPQSVSVNLYRYPLLSLLWVGGGIVVAGGLWALSGRRRPVDIAGRPPARRGSEVATGA